jgi:hypothetical protein
MAGHYSRLLSSGYPRVALVVGVAAGAMFAVNVANAGDESDGITAVQLRYSLQATTEVTPNADPACPLKLVVVGSGITNLLGPVHDVQSHCIRNDGTVDGGVFTFTGATLDGPPGGDDSQDSITGQYRARIVPALPTSRSLFTNPPGGYWLIYGEVCIWKGTGRFAGVVNDCPASGRAGRFFPARGTTDLGTGQTNIYGTAVVRRSIAP